MPLDFTPSPHVEVLSAKTTAFITDVVLPLENDFGGDITAAGGDAARLLLQSAARQAGLLAPHGPNCFGGLGLNMSDRAPIFEAAGYSLFGPLALNIAAPDEGNVHLLADVANTDQQERYLRPLVTGEIRSAFAMTEPAPGAGADPAMLTTRAERYGPGWRITGRKYFITGADGADFFIVMARTSGQPGESGGATMFLVDANTTGVHVGRHITTMDRSMVGGHCEVEFHEVDVDEAAVLGEVDEGFRYAQVRLGPARMTHVMRWLGAAKRAHDVAVVHVGTRQAFGSRLGDLGMTQKMLADNEIDIAATRALLQRACWELDCGTSASKATSIAKTFGAEAINRVVDRSIQMCGGLGVSDDLPLARISREVRPFRIYDGPSEVHRWSLAKRALRAAPTAPR
ncbi:MULTISPECIES: acyl-CoA dehydrogenase family protein [unclassified Mycolicibacterium]|uniref:acyl-CoA dehydrogenase family protein n=1 Tax=unclassified Mycolicibacterium TaxID=2636767 RepID=UPI0012DC2B39|nr:MULTISPECIES: acyl-CoA dehydrogenase family protein [unclassified Mycolicibacterium]MUL84751.1 acyl-CoA dehydrogenase family protein [Mycolicibacterium sp. CBMA 329]MUL88526.1 acyl-CoA dehydrogenase family protein [Mycolicibacterium sp. CBMA 331]MUM00135.1 acyl-CoA dehydrogenase family protein [Mycolicibacterium sp. CBMA 334]MUM27800.1 acyl-CoA dehydrogenase family protein [Mycolicibacterium sp. CBMA 295]MUM40173.1 acyl-CoA dehydrogenase family protein [Mycolicibacterium sp. CBMA 247]